MLVTSGTAPKRFAEKNTKRKSKLKFAAIKCPEYFSLKIAWFSIVLRVTQ